MTVLRAHADLSDKQVFYCTKKKVLYRCIFVLLFGRYSLQLDNNTRIFLVLVGEYSVT